MASYLPFSISFSICEKSGRLPDFFVDLDSWIGSPGFTFLNVRRFAILPFWLKVHSVAVKNVSSAFS